MADIVVTQGYNGATIRAKNGDTITVELPENPSTGYRWTVSVADNGILLLTGDEFQLSTHSTTGGGGMRLFRFMTVAQGTTQVQFKLMRSWESGAPKDVITIWVEPG